MFPTSMSESAKNVSIISIPIIQDVMSAGKERRGMNKWIAEFELEEGDIIPEHIKGAKLDLYCRPMWFPISEKLPGKGEYGKVLVTYIPSGGTLWTTVIIAHYSDLMGIAKPFFHIGEVGKESFQDITEQVIAWMPLPEPYKPQEVRDKEYRSEAREAFRKRYGISYL